MKPARLRLEVFETEDDGLRPTVVMDGEDLEDTRLAAFEQGYRAGWDDAMAAQSDDSATLRAAIAQNLRALSLDYGAARAHVTAALRPLLVEMTARLLPEVARAALPAQIAEALAPYAELAADQPVDLVVHPDAATATEAMLIDSGTDLPLRIVEDPGVGPGQALLRLGAAETRIDLDGAVDRIAGLVTDFFTQLAKDTADG